MEYTIVKVPQAARKITIQDGKLQVPDHPVHPICRRRWHRAGYLARLAAGAGCGRAKRPIGGSARSTGWKSSPAKKPTTSSAPGCRMRPCRLPGIPGGHQRSADHAHRRRHPLA